jgi:hypothetical protein
MGSMPLRLPNSWEARGKPVDTLPASVQNKKISS